MTAMQNKRERVAVQAAAGLSISGALGAACRVLPGESEQQYRQGLQATIQELGAVTHLQVYLAEKIFDTLWWIRRYEEQKRALLIREMARLVGAPQSQPRQHQHQDQPKQREGALTDLESVAMEAMFANQFDDEGLEHLASEANHSVESLRQAAFQSKRPAMHEIDAQIALLAKTLAGFQGSYEALINRGRNTERLELQNALMRRDLSAIEIQAESNDQPQKKKR